MPTENVNKENPKLLLTFIIFRLPFIGFYENSLLTARQIVPWEQRTWLIYQSQPLNAAKCWMKLENFQAETLKSLFLSFLKNFYFYFILLYNTLLVLPYIDMNPPWVYMSSQSWTPLPPPTPYHLSGSSPCTSPKHPVSCIEHRLAIRFLHDSIHVSMPFSQIIPPSSSPTESKSPFYTSVSLLLSRIQGYHYHLALS